MSSTPFTHAIVRAPAPTFLHGLTTVDEGEPDFQLMVEQHRAYCELLASLGLEVVRLDPLPTFPDACFVEDTAVIGDGFAVLTRPGAEERRGEEDAMAPVLERFSTLERISEPATVDGGDVLEIGGHYLIGVSDRTNEEGAAQLRRFLASFGRTSTALAVGTGLHLKSSVSSIDENTLLVTTEYADRAELASWERVVVPAGEEYAANTLWVNGTLIVPAGYPGTEARLREAGYDVVTLDVSEARKMDGGLSCMSLRFGFSGERP